MEEQKTRPETKTPDYHPAYCEDEIELMDLIRVIWKWKYLILVGTLICAVGAALISLNMTDIYRVQMSITPGVALLNENGENIYIDASKDIQTLIQVGTFNQQILQKLPVPDGKKQSEFLKFKIDTPKGLNEVKVSCETAHPDAGVQALGYLGNLLQEKYLDLVGYHRRVFELAQQKKTNELEYLDNRMADKKAEIATKKEHIKNLKERQLVVQEELGRMGKNTDMLIAQRNGLLSSNKSEQNIFSALLYTTTVQQNMSHVNALRNTADEIKGGINDLELGIVQLQTALNDLERQKKFLLEEINNLEFRKSNVQNIQILQPPTSSPDPVKPKKTLNVVLATVVGLFAMFFLAFFLEYIQTHKTELRSSKSFTGK